MSGSPTNIDLQDSIPSPKPDSCNVEWQAGVAVPDPSSPGNFVREVSACYRYPAVGGAFVIDDTAFVSPYLLSSNDSGQILVVNAAAAFTLQLPATAPSFSSPAQGAWNVTIINIGATVTLDRNTRNIDGAAANLTLEQFQAICLSTDGTDYWSGLTASGVVGGVISNTGTSVTLGNTHRQKLLTTSNGSSVAVTLDSSVGKGFVSWHVNLGAGTATLTPSSGTINGASNIAIATGSGCTLFFDGTNWRAVIGGGTVSSVALTMPAEFSVGGSPVTSSGTLAVTKANQSANLVYAGPSSGAAAAPTFRSLVLADIPAGGGGGVGGLFSSIMSAVPTSSGIGYTTWVNQGGTATVTDTPVGVAIFDGTGVGGTIVRGRKKAVPSTPYSAIALIAIDCHPSNDAGCGFGWTDGTKLHMMWFQEPALGMGVIKFNTVTSFNGLDFGLVTFQSRLVWLKLVDDGTNISMFYSLSGSSNWIKVFGPTAYAGTFLGVGGYTSLIFGIGPSSQAAGINVMSYQETSP